MCDRTWTCPGCAAKFDDFDALHEHIETQRRALAKIANAAKVTPHERANHAYAKRLQEAMHSAWTDRGSLPMCGGGQQHYPNVGASVEFSECFGLGRAFYVRFIANKSGMKVANMHITNGRTRQVLDTAMRVQTAVDAVNASTPAWDKTTHEVNGPCALCAPDAAANDAAERDGLAGEA